MNTFTLSITHLCVYIRVSVLVGMCALVYVCVGVCMYWCMCVGVCVFICQYYDVSRTFYEI